MPNMKKILCIIFGHKVKNVTCLDGWQVTKKKCLRCNNEVISVHSRGVGFTEYPMNEVPWWIKERINA